MTASQTVLMRTDPEIPLDLLAPIGLLMLCDELGEPHGQRYPATMICRRGQDGSRTHLVDTGGIPTAALPGLLRAWAADRHPILDRHIRDAREHERAVDPSLGKKADGSKSSNNKLPFPGFTPDGSNLASSRLFHKATAAVLTRKVPKAQAAAAVEDEHTELEQWARHEAEQEALAREMWADLQQRRDAFAQDAGPLVAGAVLSLGHPQYWLSRANNETTYTPFEATSWWGRHGSKKYRMRELLELLRTVAGINVSGEPLGDAALMGGIEGTEAHYLTKLTGEDGLEGKADDASRGASLTDYADLTRLLLALLALGAMPVFSRAGARPAAANIERVPGEQNFHAVLPIFEKPVDVATIRVVLASGAPLAAVDANATAASHERAAAVLAPYGVTCVSDINAIVGPGTPPAAWFPYAEVVPLETE